jgi:hypothetical protein
MAASLPALARQLVDVLLAEGYVVKQALGVTGYPQPQYFPNDSFGRMNPRRPAVVAFDPALNREVFGLVRTTKAELSSEDSLEEYHLFLDRNEDGGTAAAAVYVIFPEELLAEFTGILTHEIHREYWHRIVPVPSREPGRPGSPAR